MKIFILTLVCLSVICIDIQAAGCGGRAKIGRVKERLAKVVLPRLRK